MAKRDSRLSALSRPGGSSSGWRAVSIALLAAIKKKLREGVLTRHAYRVSAHAYHGVRYLLNDIRGVRNFPQAFFDTQYAADSDPWDYLSDPVAADRKALILDMLTDARGGHLLEIGCAAGWLTADLATQADSVLAVDISERALETARERCRPMEHVRFRRLDLLTDPLPGRYDVIVCAGVLVYLPRRLQRKIRDQLVALLTPGGRLLLEHTREKFPGETAGKWIHALYAAHTRLRTLRTERRDIYEVMLLQAE